MSDITDQTGAPNPFEIVPIEDEMRKSYLDYAMSVIVSRALPDVRDGLKPVHRRILYAMREGGYDIGKPYRKSARIIGDVMGKYHPHGDNAIYDAMVRMAQDFSMRMPLVDGQGNFGSMDGDPPAAMRYTEARLAKPAGAILDDFDKDTVDFRPNYDESTREPEVLPAQFPNLLVNGAGGIAVGMATNIPPHNLGEVLDACMVMIQQEDASLADIAECIQGPDFPTGGLILGRAGIAQAYATGRGSVVMRGRAEVETLKNGRERIVISEIPFQLNKSRLMERIAEVVRDKKVEGISDLRDESDRHGVRVVVDIKRDGDGEVVLNQLYKFTPLQTTFGINMVALNGGRPLLLNLMDVMRAFIDFREEVILRRTAFELSKARDRAHVLFGLALAVANLDPVIELIRAASDSEQAKAELMRRDWPLFDLGPYLALADEGYEEADPMPTTYRLSARQAQAILDLRLHRLTGLERQKITDELVEIGKKIEELLLILRSRERLLEVMAEEFDHVREQFADERRTEIIESDFDALDIEDLIQREDMVVTVTHGGYIKRVPLASYRAQRRGGKGRAGMATHDDDFLSQMFVTSTHTPVLFFSTLGRAYRLKVFRLPAATPQGRGKAMINLFPHLEDGERISAILPLPETDEEREGLELMFATSRGKVRRNAISDFDYMPSSGKIAMKLDSGDQLIGVSLCDPDKDVLLAAQGGKCVRFAVGGVRVFKSRTSEGVRGMELAEGDRVISMSILDHVSADTEERDQYLRYVSAQRRGEDAETSISAERLTELEAREQVLLTITENGYGKRSSAYEYRVTNRGGQGIVNIVTSERNGQVVGALPVAEGDQIMLVTNQGKMIRISVDDIRVAGRNTQGVTLFNTAKDEHVVAVAYIGDTDDDEEVEEDA